MKHFRIFCLLVTSVFVGGSGVALAHEGDQCSSLNNVTGTLDVSCVQSGGKLYSATLLPDPRSDGKVGTWRADPDSIAPADFHGPDNRCGNLNGNTNDLQLNCVKSNDMLWQAQLVAKYPGTQQLIWDLQSASLMPDGLLGGFLASTGTGNPGCYNTTNVQKWLAGSKAKNPKHALFMMHPQDMMPAHGNASKADLEKILAWFNADAQQAKYCYGTMSEVAYAMDPTLYTSVTGSPTTAQSNFATACGDKLPVAFRLDDVQSGAWAGTQITDFISAFNNASIPLTMGIIGNACTTVTCGYDNIAKNEYANHSYCHPAAGGIDILCPGVTTVTDNLVMVPGSANMKVLIPPLNKFNLPSDAVVSIAAGIKVISTQCASMSGSQQGDCINLPGQVVSDKKAYALLSLPATGVFGDYKWFQGPHTDGCGSTPPASKDICGTTDGQGGWNSTFCNMPCDGTAAACTDPTGQGQAMSCYPAPPGKC
ncbi:MAG: hypothetical protein HON51_08130 [Gammaproteobacteria bacterium]|nr:hypothetical protein [Gammaproteobacteria bacterium]MBT6576176.1 hypothetical protein [Gammaproteobacteria bacterium]MBT7436790.1 hypothetical protein [Gammaproteobacteria bacterium]